MSIPEKDDPTKIGIGDESAWAQGSARFSTPIFYRGRQALTHLACIRMDDPVENAIVINALQRHAAVVVEKSLAAGCGLTVAAAM